MRIKSSSLRLALASLLCLSASSLNAKEYVVKLGQSSSFISAKASFTQKFGLAALDEHEQGSLIKVDLPEDKKQAAKILADLMADQDIDYVVENIKFHALGTNDPRTSEQYMLNKVDIEGAWSSTTGSKDTVVAVIDTGIDLSHPDLAANAWTNPGEVAGNGVDDDGNGFIDDINGWDFRYNDADPTDETSDKNPGHGTHVGGIIGAVGNNGVGITGMSQTVSLMAVRFLGSDGSGDLMSGAKAIDYAANNGAHIINASWGAAADPSQTQPIVDAVSRANDKGVIFIAAAGNDGKNNDTRGMSPANIQLPNMITVAASDANDAKPSWSNFGRANVHVASPGDQILSTIPGNAYRLLRGTSMATPAVSGVAALLYTQAKASGRSLTGDEMRSYLQASGDGVSIEVACDCRINAGAAMTALNNDALMVVPVAKTVAPGASQKFSAVGGKGPYSFTSSNASVGNIDANGNFQASAEGQTTLTVTDSTGATAQSLNIFVKQASSGGGGGGGEQCPFEPQMCDALCQIQPTLPWCN